MRHGGAADGLHLAKEVWGLLDAKAIKRLRELESENARLKRRLAESITAPLICIREIQIQRDAAIAIAGKQATPCLFGELPRH